jgi:hypothetical protein
MLAETKDPTMESSPYGRIFPLNLRGRRELELKARGVKCTKRVLVTMQAGHCQPFRGQSWSSLLRILLQQAPIPGHVSAESHDPKDKS